jgi:hypothetical protein
VRAQALLEPTERASISQTDRLQRPSLGKPAAALAMSDGRLSVACEDQAMVWQFGETACDVHIASSKLTTYDVVVHVLFGSDLSDLRLFVGSRGLHMVCLLVYRSPGNNVKANSTGYKQLLYGDAAISPIAM